MKHGFRDGVGHPIADGVWLSNYPLDINEFSKPGASQALAVDVQLTRDELFSKYEVIEIGKPYREFCIPSMVLNGKTEITVLTVEQTYGIEQEQIWNDYPPGQPMQHFYEHYGDAIEAANQQALKAE